MPKLSLLVDGGGRAAAFLFFMIMALTTAPPSAFARDIFSTSYEEPTYSVGPLDGQDGWVRREFNAPSPGAEVNVTSDFSLSGSQAVEVLGAVSVSQCVGGPGVSPDCPPVITSEPRILVRQAVYLTGTPTLSASVIPVRGDAGFIGQVGISNGVASLGLADTGVGSVPVENEKWLVLELLLDFDTQRQEAYVDGEFIGSGPFASPSTQLTEVQLFVLNGPPFPEVFGEFGEDGVGPPLFVDDLRVSTVPVVPTCDGHDATIFVDADGFIVGGRSDGHPYHGVLFGTFGEDVIVGTEDKDLLFGLSGPDKTCGLGGRDLLIGGLGDDELFGDEGKDGLFGGPGNDILDGGPSVDLCIGGRGHDQLLSCERGDDDDEDDDEGEDEEGDD